MDENGQTVVTLCQAKGVADALNKVKFSVDYIKWASFTDTEIEDLQTCVVDKLVSTM